MIWAFVAFASALPEPTEATAIYYNARMALREGRPAEATRLWLLRNAWAAHAGVISSHDADFRSVTWAALGDLGVCQDGYPTDDDGAGLWPVALHNWVVRNRSANRTKRPRPFDAFDVGRQQRYVGVLDVLDADELATVKFTRGRCARPRWMLIAAGEEPWAKLSDRRVALDFMERLLERSEATLDPDVVRGRAAIDARRFDLHLARAELAARAARQRAGEQARRGRDVGLSSEGVSALRDDVLRVAFQDPVPARVLRESAGWPVSEWMALSADRRVFLFDQARAFGADADALDAIALGLVDALAARGEGAEVARWIARRGVAGADREVWGGERGQRLLGLGADSGFRERSTLALHQGVHRLEQGDLPGALRAFAFALQRAEESAASEALRGLSLRWLSYVASQFEITDALLLSLQELVPRREYGILLEDLMWGAALRADRASFDRGVQRQVGRGALARRLDLLAPLADGDVGRFIAGVRAGLTDAPGETTRFLDQLVQRVELEDADVRGAHVTTLLRLRDALGPLADAPGGQGRSAAGLRERMLAITDGLGALDADPGGRARGLNPAGEVFAGSVRLAPSDPLPWPFRASEVAPPSVFEPIRLVPEEWPDGQGGWVFGWSLRG